MSSRHPSPKAVALVCPPWPRSANGIATYTKKISAALRRAGTRVFVLPAGITGPYDDIDVIAAEWPGRERGELRRILTRLRVRGAGPDGEKRLYARRILSVIARLVRDEGLEIMQMEESNGWVERVAEKSPVPVVTRLHGPWFLNGRANGVPEDEKFKTRVEAEGRGIASAAGVTAPSQDVIDQTRGHYGLGLEHARAIANPVDLVADAERWRPEGCEAGCVLFVGRFDRHKGGDLVIDAFEEIHRRNPGARLLFVGPDRGLTDDAGRIWRIEDYLATRLSPGARAAAEWLRQLPRERLPELRRRAAVTVVPSRYENFANTATEALAFGSPLVLARTGGLREMVDHGRNGLFFDPSDSSSLAESVLELLEDPERAAQLGHAAAADAEARFHPDRCAEKTLAYYAETLGRAGATG